MTHHINLIIILVKKQQNPQEDVARRRKDAHVRACVGLYEIEEMASFR